MFGLKSAITDEEKWLAFLTPLGIIMIFFAYPLLVYRHLNQNMDLVINKNEEYFMKKHGAAILNIKT